MKEDYLIEVKSRIDRLEDRVLCLEELRASLAAMANKQNWLAAFEEDFTHLAELASYPVHLSACRHAYYTRGFRSLAESDDPSSFIFPLIRTWLDIQLALSQPSPRLNAWLTLIEGLNLTENVHKTKIEALDAYLDNLEVLIEDWAEVYGA